MKPTRIVLWVAVALAGAVAFGFLALGRGENVSAIWLLTAALASYALGYRFYSLYIAKNLLQLDDSRVTPAMRHPDGLDYVPTPTPILFGHHFAAIAGAGPLIGPVLAINRRKMAANPASPSLMQRRCPAAGAASRGQRRTGPARSAG